MLHQAHNPYRAGYGVGSSAYPGRPSSPNGSCGLPAPMPAGGGACAQAPGQRYCRGHMGGSVALAAAGTGTIVLTPTNATEFVARWLHMTATSAAAVSPVSFTQAFSVTSIQILGDNQLANAGPVIGSTWSAQQTFLEVFWARAITANNPLSIAVTNLDPALAIVVFASTAGDFVKN